MTAARLAGKTVVVFGATGNVGSAASIGFLNCGAKVVAPVRTAGRALSRVEPFVIKSSLDSLVEVVADLSTKEGQSAILKATSDGKDIDHVAAAVGPYYDLGPLSSISPEAFVNVYKSNLYTHFHIWRLLAPYLLDKSGASYTIVTGKLGLHPGANGITGISDAAVFALADGMSQEAKDRALRFTEMRLAFRCAAEDDHFEGEDFALTPAEFSPIFPGIAANSGVSGVQHLTCDKWNELKA